MPELTEQQRRALAHLPRWRSAKDAKEAAERMRKAARLGDDWVLPQSRLVSDLDALVAADEYAPKTNVGKAVKELEKAGLVDVAGDAVSMTEQGLAALQE